MHPKKIDKVKIGIETRKKKITWFFKNRSFLLKTIRFFITPLRHYFDGIN
jgi:hypothetical protein